MGALIPLVLAIAPEVAHWLFGSERENALNTVSALASKITGTTDPAAQQAAMERDASLANSFRIELVKLAVTADGNARKRELSELRASLADAADARRQTVALAQVHSPIAYGAPIVSFTVLSTFAIVMALALTRSLPSGSETTINMLLGSLAAMATSVVSYWVGSSAGSARKDDRLARMSAS